MFKRPFRRALHQGAAPNIPPALRKANQMMAGGHYEAAAGIFEQFAQAATALQAQLRESPGGSLAGPARFLAAECLFQQDKFDEALTMLPAADRHSQKPGLMMASIYRTLLREIESDGFKVLNQRVSLTPLRKLWIAWRTWIKG